LFEAAKRAERQREREKETTYFDNSFLNARQFHTVVCDYLCMNPDSLRRNPIFSPSKKEKIGSKCNSSQCTLKTCRLVSCHSKIFCHDHHPWPELLMKLLPIFRVPIYGGDDLWHHNPFLHFTEHVYVDRHNRKLFSFVWGKSHLHFRLAKTNS